MASPALEGIGEKRIQMQFKCSALGQKPGSREPVRLGQVKVIALRIPEPAAARPRCFAPAPGWSPEAHSWPQAEERHTVLSWPWLPVTINKTCPATCEHPSSVLREGGEGEPEKEQ